VASALDILSATLIRKSRYARRSTQHAHLSLPPLTSLCLSAQVDSWLDDFDVGALNESSLALAEEKCGSSHSSNSSCNLRTAFLYASSLVGSDVEIFVNVGQQEIFMEQGAAINISG